MFFFIYYSYHLNRQRYRQQVQQLLARECKSSIFFLISIPYVVAFFNCNLSISFGNCNLNILSFQVTVIQAPWVRCSVQKPQRVFFVLCCTHWRISRFLIHTLVFVNKENCFSGATFGKIWIQNPYILLTSFYSKRNTIDYDEGCRNVGNFRIHGFRRPKYLLIKNPPSPSRTSIRI